jgi:transposase InsO family protein
VGHPGVKRTLDLLIWRGKRWPGMCADRGRYIKGCMICQQSKPRTGKGPNPLREFPVPGAPWEVMSWNLVRPLPESRLFNTIITMVNTRMKAIKLEPANIMISAMGATVVMRNQVYQEEGLPVKVISDHRPQFMSRFMKELYGLLGIEGNLSTAYHPQTDGQMERMNREVEKYLQMFTSHQQED